MDRIIACIGFGEAARAFALGWPDLGVTARAYDVKAGAAMLRAFAQTGVQGCASARDAVGAADAVLSLVTADQALAAATAAAPSLRPGALWLDMNSVAPETKRAAAAVIERHGGHYADVAVMAPVHPARRAVPVLISGPHAQRAATSLAALGFSDVRVIAGAVGAASAIKMIRSVMVKGLEALSAECILAAEAAGVRDEVIASLNASQGPADWAQRMDYNLERMLVHGLRRAAEMEEAVKTLDTLGTGSTMTRGTVDRQRELGALGLAAPDTLDAKLDQLLGHRKDRAA